MTASIQPVSGPIYQLKVMLKGSKPPIWRRFQVPGNISLRKLHLILQEVMGWTNSHLYRFEIGGTEFGEPENESYGLEVKNSHRTKLIRVAPREKTKFTYEYDFGDSWEHEILVEKILQAEPGVRYPVCLAGKRACPPEDCGGIWGYAHLLEVIRDPAHEEHEEMMEWLGGQFDPEEFDLDRLNQRLKGHVEKGTARASPKIGGYDPCPGGSGKKYRECCGAGTQPAPLPDRRLMERTLRSIEKLMTKQHFGSVDEMNAYLKQFNTKGHFPEWIPETPMEQAQELVYQALETTEKKERIRLAIESLKICDDCADAYVLLAEEAAEIPEQARNWYQRGMEAGERALGPEVFAKGVGHFWGLIETRPYMRAREGLADCLCCLGQRDVAIEHYRDMLRLNPNDNQGIRYKLLRCLMERNNIDAAKELLEQYKNEYSADWFFMRALITFVQQGASREANKQLRKAVKQNAHVVPYLLREREMPLDLPDRIGFGDEDEAISHVAEFADVWLGIPGALEWIKTMTQGER
jgi:tetratricopeptide (TPR) repeat protein